MSTCVWAYQALKELDGKTGFVACSEELAAELIASGKAQDPRDGGNSLKHILKDGPTEPDGKVYETKVMAAEAAKVAKVVKTQWAAPKAEVKAVA